MQNAQRWQGEPSLILFSRVQRSWNCKNILCWRECTHHPKSGVWWPDYSWGDKEVQSLAVQQLDCVECNMHRCADLLKDKVVTNDTIIASNVCWDSKVSQQQCFHTMLDEEHLPFLIQRPTQWQTGKHQALGKRSAECYAPFLGPVWCTQSIVLTVKLGQLWPGDIW